MDSRRSLFVTALGWIMVMLGIGIASGAAFALAVFEKTYRSAPFVNGLFAAHVLWGIAWIVTGFGLARRRGWARNAAILVFTVIVVEIATIAAYGVWQVVSAFAGRSDTTVFIAGTIVASLVTAWVPALCIARLMSEPVRAEFGGEAIAAG